jgi:hypothetical protein
MELDDMLNSLLVFYLDHLFGSLLNDGVADRMDYQEWMMVFN